MPTYVDHPGVNARLDQIRNVHGRWCMVELLPEESHEHRDVRMMRITKAFDPAKPAVLINAGIHGDERAQPDGVLAFCQALLDAYAGGLPLIVANYTLPADRVKAIVDNLTIYVIPLSNPDGRTHNTRKNARPAVGGGGVGVDLNRNFDILFKYRTHFKLPDADVHSDDTDTTADVYTGTDPFTEPESRNIKWVLEQKHILYYFDLHAAVPGIYYPWGLDTNQGTDTSKNFANGFWDGKRDGVGNAAYSEFIPDPIRDAHQSVATAMRNAIQRATASSYVTEQSATMYVTSGASDDYWFSWNLEQHRTFTIEFGTEKEPDPTAASGLPKVIDEIKAALAAGLSAFAGASAAPPPPAPPSGGLWAAIKAFFRWLFGVFVLLLRPPPSGLTPISSPRPTPAPPPATAPVHSLRLSTSIASAGQVVHGSLLDNSLDFTQIVRSAFQVYLQVPPRPGAMGNLYYRVPQVRFLGPRDLELVIPPVGVGNPALMVPPGAYIVLCRYGFWTVEGDRLLTVR